MADQSDPRTQHLVPVLNTQARITASLESMEVGDQFVAGQIMSDLLVELNPYTGGTVITYAGTALF